MYRYFMAVFLSEAQTIKVNNTVKTSEKPHLHVLYDT